MAEIQIAKTGRARGTDGKDHEITPEMLREVAASYDPKLHEAPLVLGHPKTDDPAHGWVSGLSFSEEDGVLLATTRDVDPEFAEAVTTKRTFPKRSASFYGPTSKANPTPGKWHLRHVGFLGAATPGMKGLAEVVSFREGDEPEEASTYEFADGSWEDRELARVLRSLREWIVAKWGLEEADKAMPSWRVDTIQEAAASGGSTAFAEALAAVLATPKDEPAGAVEDEATAAPAAELSPELAARFAELEAREKALVEKEAALAAQAKADAARAKAAEHLAFCESLVASGRALPIPAAAVVGLMAHLEGLDEPDVLSFGEGRESAAPVTVFRELLERLPISVDFAERSRGEGEEVESPEAKANRIRQIQADAASRGEFLTTVQAAQRLES